MNHTPAHSTAPCSAATEEVATANIFDIRNMGIPCIPSSDIMK